MFTLLSSAFQDEPVKPPASPESPFYWMPTQSSTVAGNIDLLFDFLVWISAISCIGILIAMVYFCTKYRAKSRHDKPLPSTDHNTTLELTWSGIPLVIVIGIFVWGFKDFMDLRTVPRDSYEVHATGQKWKWLFQYSNGYMDDVLHVPVNRNVRVVISSADVLHSLFIPAFRVKMDAVPGRYTELWFNATEPGEFPVFCAEYCGTAHSDMLTRVVVHPEGGFEEWLETAEEKMMDLPPLELGQLMYTMHGCGTCHSTDGTTKTGPSFKGSWATQRPLDDGTEVLFDENYARESILDPQAKIVKGFPPAMPTFKGKLNDRQITGLIEFIKAQK